MKALVVAGIVKAYLILQVVPALYQNQKVDDWLNILFVVGRGIVNDMSSDLRLALKMV